MVFIICLYYFFANLVAITHYPIPWIRYCCFASTNRNKPKPQHQQGAYPLCPFFNGFVDRNHNGLSVNAAVALIPRGLANSGDRIRHFCYRRLYNPFSPIQLLRDSRLFIFIFSCGYGVDTGMAASPEYQQNTFQPRSIAGTYRLYC